MLGVTAVIENEQIIGIITDGDIRRMLKNHQNIGELKARDIMSASPKTIDEDELAVEALDLLEKKIKFRSYWP